ncbi:hypothetical protein R5R35_014490 [Gryllus longicercus]|uniref:Major facilitator superfamily (MFS) profile domain-containing protein n=2 Tax=Gryllus longicercus TaxID=2509291 RepID=A0AAN9V4S0_9ORTH
MDNSAIEEPGVWYRVRHVRTIIIAVTVSFVIVPQFLNGMSFNGVTHDITDVWHTNGDWPHLRSWDEVRRTTQISYIVVGTLASALFAFLFERYRRKTCLYLVCTCHFITSILLICTNSYWLLHVTRAFCAIGDVGAGMFCVIYVSEIAPYEIRGGLVAIHKLLYDFIDIIPFAIYLLHIPLKSLPFSFVSIAVSVFVAICTYVCVPESPIYFLRRDDMTGALESFKFLHKNETDVNQILSNKKNILKATRSDFETTTNIFQDYFNRRTLTFSCIAIALYLLRIMASFWLKGYGSEAVLWGLPKFKLSLSPRFWIMQELSIIFCNLLAIALCDRVGRRKLFLVSAFVSSISSVVCGVILIAEQYNLNNETVWDRLQIVYYVFNVLHLLSFNMGLNFLPEVLIADIFPPKILNIQVAMLSSFHISADYVLHYEINSPWKDHTSLIEYWLLWIFGGLSFFLTFFIVKFLSETKRRPPGFMYIEIEDRVLYSALQDDME